MLPASDISAYAALAAALGALMLKVDRWAHSPASLQKEIDVILKRLDTGNDRFSTGMSKVNTKMEQIDDHLNSVDLRLTKMEGREEARSETPRPRTR